jgi:dTDP-4-dehydrorhamnose 3,5-epimerase
VDPEMGYLPHCAGDGGLVSAVSGGGSSARPDAFTDSGLYVVLGHLSNKRRRKKGTVIDGVKIFPLRQIQDERGKIMHMLRSTDGHFIEFGEVYFSCIYPGTIKAWHLHKYMTLNYAVPVGHIKLVLYDDRANSPTKGELMEIFTGPDSYQLITIPPLVWNGFKGIGISMSVVANCATLPHDSGEIERLDPFSSLIPYDWGLKHG